MDLHLESRLLRMAISRGFLQWEDLDAVADRLPGREDGREPGSDGAQDSIPSARWLEARVVADLRAELERERDDLTARLETDPARRAQADREAAATLGKALEAILRREYGGWLAGH